MAKAEQNLIVLDGRTEVTENKAAQYDIKNMIYIVRNQQVMIDHELAML